MSAGSLQTFWFPLLALLAVEVGVTAALVEVLQRWSSSAGWRRTFCQAGLVAVLALSVGELSGAARSVAGRVAGVVSGVGRSVPPHPGPVPKGEGESSAASRHMRGSRKSPSGRTAVPSPLGEGQGEGRVSRGEGRGAGVEGRRASVEGRHLIPSTLDARRSRPSTLDPRPSASAAELPAGFWLVLVWGTGGLAVGGRVCFARCVFVLFRLRRCETADRALVERMERLAQTLGLRRRVRLMVSARLAGPIAFGWIWPSVALPAGFAAQLDSAKQDAVLLHELAHLAAHDPFWNLVADAATVVLWWHPAVWWLRRRLQLANELAADEASLLVADGPRVLAECLVQLGARLLERPVAGQIPVTGFRSHLGRRVQRLMRLEGRTWSPPRRLSAALARSFGAAATAAAVVLCTAWATPRELTKGDSMKTIQQNWKQSLAAFAFLAAINGHDAVGREAQSLPAAPAPAASAAAPAGPTPAAVSALAASAMVPVSTNRIEAKLKSIVLDEVKPIDVLPLSEVLKLLSQWAVKSDPEGIGVNFLMDYKQPPSPAPGARAVDRATGLPVAGVPVKTVDPNAVCIRIPSPLHNVTLREMLDVLLIASDGPIQYTVEEYGVLFSLKPEARAPEPKPVLAAAPERLSVRTFKLDTNTVVAAIEHTFDIDARHREIQYNMELVFQRLSVRPRPNSIFYNGLTGVLMVRANREDMEVVSAVMETLTGVEQKRDPFQPEAGAAGKGSGSGLKKGPSQSGNAAP